MRYNALQEMNMVLELYYDLLGTIGTLQLKALFWLLVEKCVARSQVMANDSQLVIFETSHKMSLSKASRELGNNIWRAVNIKVSNAMLEASTSMEVTAYVIR